MAEKHHHHHHHLASLNPGSYQRNQSPLAEKQQHHHHKEVSYTKTTTVVTVTKEVKYEKIEEKHQKKHLGKVDAVAAGSFSLYEKHETKKYLETKKNLEHAHKGKIKVATVAARGGGHGQHEKEAKEKSGKSHEKKHHH